MDAKAWALAHYEEQVALLDTLCRIPAPSHKEEKRAEYIKAWLEERGCKNVFIDDALNVIVPPRAEGKATLLMAHTDTVFPDMEPFEPKIEGDRMYCPGVGDDTANVTALMLLAEYAAAQQGEGWDHLIFAANSCEEGLGNLKGCRALMARYGENLKQVLSIDCGYDGGVNRAVGSARYEVTIRTEGGHSFGSFGNRNAIHAMAVLISSLYSIKPPKVGNSKTTYNVGMISGGTSVNTIAQEASMLYEYRSDNAQCMEMMEKAFMAQIEAVRAMGVEAEVKVLGVRPGMGEVDEDVQNALEALCQAAVAAETGKPMGLGSASTDINMPLSMGIPALCFGAYLGGGAHTREEWLQLSSLPVGLAIWMRVLYALAKE